MVWPIRRVIPQKYRYPASKSNIIIPQSKYELGCWISMKNYRLLIFHSLFILIKGFDTKGLDFILLIKTPDEKILISKTILINIWNLQMRIIIRRDKNTKDTIQNKHKKPMQLLQVYKWYGAVPKTAQNFLNKNIYLQKNIL